MKRILYIATILLSFTITGCLKDKGFDDNKTGFQTDNSARFVAVLDAYETNGINTQGIFLDPAEEQFEYFILSVTGAVYHKEVTVNVAVNNTLVTNHNTANGTHYEILPATAYEIPASVSIPAGREFVPVRVKLKKATLDPTKEYALAVELTSSNDAGVKVAGNTRQSILSFVVKNKYDGIYELRAHTFHPVNPALTGPVGPAEVSLVTSGIHSVTTASRHAWANGSGSGLPDGYFTIFTVDPATNFVTISDANGIGFANSPAYDTRYDPATKTFYAKWQYSGSGGARVFTDTLVFLRLRP